MKRVECYCRGLISTYNIEYLKGGSWVNTNTYGCVEALEGDVLTEAEYKKYKDYTISAYTKALRVEVKCPGCGTINCIKEADDYSYILLYKDTETTDKYDLEVLWDHSTLIRKTNKYELYELKPDWYTRFLLALLLKRVV